MASSFRKQSRPKRNDLRQMSPATFSRRMKDPDSITIGELRRLDQLARFRDEQLLELIRGK